MISLFDLFKIGIGPSSSHTVGPMRAARRFAAHIGNPGEIHRIRVTLYGSLAWTAQGHATDKAVILGLAGETPEGIDPDDADNIVHSITSHRQLTIDGQTVAFDPATDIVLDRETRPPVHPNTLQFEALGNDGSVIAKARFCSVGGGFIVPEEVTETTTYTQPDMPHDFTSGQELLDRTRESKLSIAGVVMANESALRPRAEIDAYLDRIIDTMMACIERGLTQRGTLPGRLHVRRRAAALHERLQESALRNQRPAHEVMDWVSLFAIAVNEENASGGRVITAPTNGAAGVIPAVLRYYRDFCPEASRQGMRDFLLTAAAIGGLFKLNASISGAEVGCQGEVGVASSMAAAGLAAALGANPLQIENAAEIGMEHHLGMTCDPVAGLVQIPCIERNAFGAVKAINAASLAMHGDGAHHVSLDQVIRTMAETGRDMSHRYKETSLGGLAVNFPEC
ncbi:L-serine deaminase [Neoasaia chiangmaiensis NBRC 101099]|uniref:L-serine dehydratase n=1 Tax=Neoasaia chiangmaiensis TaxID=320497 RepID=A0A1U9KPG0_9PROT|nr:L-serine ammonia-lyase [Neoasaia chiangmaiensis]AQS87711.1 L-serine ammonia-lyase [Neoasaia chiangmaiensis]GBR41786.1 L-serine deaminase [Neoasaia chiangmaiensis NBRC 101099]GEN14300.1 L-serine dehydratase [Neoasaia chiangmaiensis]